MYNFNNEIVDILENDENIDLDVYNSVKQKLSKNSEFKKEKKLSEA